MILDELLIKLKAKDLNIQNIAAYKTSFKSGYWVNYQDYGRKQHLLHFITNGYREYRLAGQCFTLEAGNLLFIPENTKYATRSFDDNGKQCSGIGICFDSDLHFEEKELRVYHTAVENQQQMIILLNNIYETYIKPTGDIFRLKSLIFQLLSVICAQSANQSSAYNLIKPALVFIQEHYAENLPVRTYSQICNLSESYFRKLFLEHTGLSPIHYRNALRLAVAKEMYQDNRSTQEIADALGFCDANYFLKIYKKVLGTPLRQNSNGI